MCMMLILIVWMLLDIVNIYVLYVSKLILLMVILLMTVIKEDEMLIVFKLYMCAYVNNVYTMQTITNHIKVV